MSSSKPVQAEEAGLAKPTERSREIAWKCTRSTMSSTGNSTVFKREPLVVSGVEVEVTAGDAPSGWNRTCLAGMLIEVLTPAIVVDATAYDSLHLSNRPALVTFGEGDDVHVGEGEALEEPRGVLLVPAERSNASASTISNRPFKASRMSDWKPARSSVAPEIA